MKGNLIHCLYFVVIIIILSCNNNESNIDIDIDTAVQLTTDTTKSENVLSDSLQPQPFDVESPVVSESTPIDTIPKIRLGKHHLTLQWISWDNPGTVTIEPSDDGWYNIEGRQDSRAGDDYLTITGKIKPITDKELLFRGVIEHRVETLNDGKPCRKEGEQIFLSTKGRRYWRMQDMQNCEGGMVTDYIDIYF